MKKKQKNIRLNAKSYVIQNLYLIANQFPNISKNDLKGEYPYIHVGTHIPIHIKDILASVLEYKKGT